MLYMLKNKNILYIYIYVQSTFDNIFNSILTKQYLRRSKDPFTGFRNKR